MKRNKLLATLAGVTTLAVTLTACGSKEPAQDEGKKVEGDLTNKTTEVIKAEDPSKSPDTANSRKDTIVIGIDDTKGVFNPLYAKTAYDQYVVKAMFASIMDVKLDGSLEPALGDVKASEDLKTYTITLKDGLKWNDGKPITTDDIEFSFMVLSDKKFDGNFDMPNLNVKGWREYNEGTSDKISGLEKVDDKVIKIHLEEPNSAALYDVAIRPIPKHFYSQYYSQGEADKLMQVHRAPGVFSGPYKLKDFKQGQSATLEANENYYKGKAKIPNLIYKVTNKQTAMQQLETGEVDMNILTVNPENIEQAKGKGFLDLSIYPTNGYGYIAFNHRNEALKDQKVRQALTFGLDRKAIVDNVYKGYADVINIPESKVSLYFTDDVEKYEYNAEKANQLLDEAGWKKGSSGIREKDGKKLTLKFLASTPNEVNEAIIPIAKENYKALGIEFNPEQMDFNTISTKVEDENADYDMYFMAWGLTPEPDSSAIFKTKGALNRNGYSNPKIDELLSKGTKTNKFEERKKVYHEFYKEVNKDLPYIFVYQRRDMWAVNARVKGVNISPYRDFTYDLDKYELQQ
ncbi:peptide ABC transporter substrate-binding protein [Clostridium sp. MSJ-4]|uniref:Peptide ABC transporter substrate-binding protein n=1 Tax=Clostridium simiarum TaxID=2841506 RepID=A0ABS6F0M1_9CLOT|nr:MULTISPECIES: ABC transporter substrate-binding protein [Clostridium]MBU5592051.1 peptide ABC transporter substrate-binding protein [Clostridium simiarum]